ncbi:42166_t:CDS:2, partial [Gigaspora margarita]
TKIAQSSIGDLALSNPYYKVYTSNYDGTGKNKRETSLGIALLLAPQLQQYIHNINKILNTQEKVLERVQQAKRKNMLVIMMGILMITLQERREADGVTDSDHVILKTSWKINLRAKPRRKKKTIRKCYQYDKTLEEDWTKFKKFINKKMAEEWKIEEIMNVWELNKAWHCTSQINKELEYIRRKTKHEILTVSAISWYTGNKTRLEQQIDELRKALRRDKFTDNTKGMIKSVLKRKVAPVILNNLKQKDSIITDVRRIKKEVEEHFLKWTNTNQSAIPMWQDWIAKYNPSDQVNSSWFETTVKKIN